MGPFNSSAPPLPRARRPRPPPASAHVMAVQAPPSHLPVAMAAGAASPPIGCKRGGRKGPSVLGLVPCAPSPCRQRPGPGALQGGPGRRDRPPAPRAPPSCPETVRVNVISFSLEWEAGEGQKQGSKKKVSHLFLHPEYLPALVFFVVFGFEIRPCDPFYSQTLHVRPEPEFSCQILFTLAMPRGSKASRTALHCDVYTGA